MLLVYSETSTPRLQYILSELLTAAGIESFRLINDRQYFISADGPKLNYSLLPVASEELLIAPHTLLFENSIKEQFIEPGEWNGLKCFFFSGVGDVPFDMFAASFYLLSRYEEYLEHEPDKYGRYSHKSSLAFRHLFLHQPLINLWLKALEELLRQKWPALKFKESSFRFLPTYDVDVAFKLKGEDYFTQLLITGKALISKGISKAIKYNRIRDDKEHDPYDVFEWLNDLHTQRKLKPVYFFLVASEKNSYDKNNSLTNTNFTGLIKSISAENKYGLHPSFRTTDNNDLLKEEKIFLEKITGSPVTCSRQHYLRMRMPDTYRELISLRIGEDYSMGYGTINGFKASYCLPFHWFDLERNKETELLIYPFSYMDSNSIFHQGFTPEQSLIELKQQSDIIKEVGGMMITVVHNHFMGYEKPFNEWRDAYESFINEIMVL